jgi:cell filamentation protein
MNGDDPYLYPGSTVLRNKLGVLDADALARAEAALVAVRQAAFDVRAVAMTPEGLRAIHRELFQDVYAWAGEYRTVDLAKVIDEAREVRFERAAFVGVGVRRLFGELDADDRLAGLDPDTFAYRAAVYHDDLNALHPFREGNGRTGRVWLKALALQAGHTLDLTRIDPARWIDAATENFGEGVRAERRLMTGVIRAAIVGPA